MSLIKKIDIKLTELYRLIDGGHTNVLDDIHCLEDIRTLPVECNDDALSRKKDIERIIGEDITFPELDEVLVSHGLIDIRKVRRRVEDALRKKGSDEVIMKLARYLGVPRY